MVAAAVPAAAGWLERSVARAVMFSFVLFRVSFLRSRRFAGFHLPAPLGKRGVSVVLERLFIQQTINGQERSTI